MTEELIIELNNKVYQLNDFELTFGDVLNAKQKARRSKTQKSRGAFKHELLWLTDIVFQNNGYDIDIDKLVEAPIGEMKHVLDQIESANPDFEKE